MNNSKPKGLTPTLDDRLMHDYRERLGSHLQDGYCLRHETYTSQAVVCRLHHMANGNDIILIADGKNHTLTQKTNRIVTHFHDYRT